MSRRSMLGLGLAGLALAGCADSEKNISGVPGYTISSVTVSPALDTLFVPDTLRPTDRATFTAVALGKNGGILPVSRYAWSTSDPSIAVVDSFGVVTPRAYGTVEVTASATRVGHATLVILPVPYASFTVSPGLDSLLVDEPIVSARDTVRLRAVVRDSAGQVVTGVAFTWQSSAAGTATVDQTGFVRAVSLGTATITARTASLSAQAVVQVVPLVASVAVTPTTSQVLALDTVRLAATAKTYSGATVPRTFTWTSSNATVATVDAQGNVQVLAAGQATITARTAFRTATATITALPRQLVAMDAGEDFTCGFTPLGRGYCWGIYTKGQLGAQPDSTCTGDTQPPNAECTLLPKRMLAPELAFASMSAGGEFACGLTTAQSLYCWGSDDLGQIGNGGTGGGATPALATVKAERFTTLSAGAEHACALNLAGVAYCWGSDATGQLGDLRRIHSTTPIPVADTTLQFKAISAGARHTCALTIAGTAYCWGDGRLGQLGNGDSVIVESPVPVSGGETYTAISAGGNHTCAITTSGAVMCWGDNSRGQLGTGTAGVAQLVPVPAASASTFTAISAGALHTCGIGAGLAVCWGGSDDGQVGDGNAFVHNVVSPTTVSGGLAATSITAAVRHTCAINAATGQSWCWGSNRFGALGNEYQAAIRATPQLVARPR